jgi:tetratricopeptide (TPR) repeat protein
LAIGAPPAEAQLALNRSTERVLFLAPRPAQQADSAFAVDVATEFRQRMANRMRHKLVIIPSTDVCNMLRDSGYPCDVLLNVTDADRLARALKSDAYIIGTLHRNGAVPIARLHLIDVQHSGLSGWTEVHGTPGDPPRAFADAIGDSLESQVRAAEFARECTERRDRGDFREAKDRAQRAFQLYPYHPSAALCAEVVSEALREPVDSQVAYLERAVRGDSTLARAHQRLGQLYMQRAQPGDTLNALESFGRHTILQPANRDLRVGVIVGAITQKQYQYAVELSDDWLESNPDDVGVIQYKARACVEGGLWGCALAALSRQLEVDTSVTNDSTFFAQLVGAAQAAGDTAAQVRWTGEAVRRFPESVSMLRAHAAALNGVGMLDSVVTVYEHILTLDSTDATSAFAGAQILLAGVTIDTLTVLDTARLLKGGEFLAQAARAARAAGDTGVMINVALQYYQRGRALVQTNKSIPIAIAWLEQADSNDVRRVLADQVNFFLAYGIVYRIFEIDPQALETKSCDLVDEEERLIRRGKQALAVGASVAPGAAQQFQQRFQTMEDRLPNLRASFKCR